MMRKHRRIPSVMMRSDDHERLAALATAARARTPGAPLLLKKLSRATLAPTTPDGVVRMNSVVSFEYNGLSCRDMTLVFDEDTDVLAGRLSVLTPAGAMLLGMAAGEAVEWRDEAGRLSRLKVEHVSAPGRAEAENLA